MRSPSASMMARSGPSPRPGRRRGSRGTRSRSSTAGSGRTSEPHAGPYGGFRIPGGIGRSGLAWLFHERKKRYLPQGVERGPNLAVRRTYPGVVVDAHPGDLSRLVDYERGGIGNASLGLLEIARVLQAVCVDDAVLGIRQQRERDRALAVAGDFVGEATAVLGGVHADAPQRDRFSRLEQRPQLGKLPSTVGSP